MTGTPLEFDDVRAAAGRIAPYAHRTPILTNATLDRMSGKRLFFKCENFQRVGAFKFRGACNAVFSLTDDEAKHGVVAHSSGNHAQALALAANLRGISARIVMPENAAAVKKAAVEDYGAEITFCEPTLSARETTAQRIVEQTGAQLVHPYNDTRVIAGQGTAALELLQEVDALDAVIAPVGGGGLLSGTALAVAGIAPNTTVLGAEPEGADDAFRSFAAGRIIPLDNPDTIADGLVTSLGDLTFPIIRDHVREIIMVDDTAIVRAMRLVWERMKIVIEPSAAVPLAAVLESTDSLAFERIGIIVSGGNVDLDRLPW